MSASGRDNAATDIRNATVVPILTHKPGSGATIGTTAATEAYIGIQSIVAIGIAAAPSDHRVSTIRF